MDLWNLTGPEFLEVYIGLLAAALLAACWIRRALRHAPARISAEGGTLDAYEAAYLSGGDAGAVNAALASLAYRHRISADPGTRRVKLDNPSTSDLHPFELEVVRHLDDRVGRTPSTIGRSVASPLRDMRHQLLEKGLVMTPSSRRTARWFPVMLVGIVAAIGMYKIYLGVIREKPVIFLVLLTALAVIVMIRLFRKPFRTTAGDAALAQLRSEHRNLNRSLYASEGSQMPGEEISLAVGLFGVSILGTGMTDLRHILVPPSHSGSSFIGGCGSGCGSGCGGGGGCGGCGGCGG